MKFQYRVTKYDPRYRNQLGHYTEDEWTAFSDVGRSFDGTILTQNEYVRVETAYVENLVAFMTESDVAELSVFGVENQLESRLVPNEGDVISTANLATVARRILREEFWCRLESATAFAHFGRDYYMYVGLPHPCPKSCESARSSGLFVEPLDSPYHELTGGDEDVR